MSWKLHAVIVHKPISLNEARQISRRFITNPNIHFYRETPESYRFRNIPKTRFKQFRTRVINDKISLIYGSLI